MTPQSAPDLAAARSGDQQAFGRLIEARWHRLVRLARSVVGDVDAEDVAQDACVACWRKLSQLADPARFDAWLMRIVFTRAVRHVRWQRLRNLVAWDPASEGFRPGQPGGSKCDAETNLFVWQVLSRLPARQRAVLHLTLVEGMTDAEIAETLRIRASSVRAHRRRARERIEAVMSKPRTGLQRDDRVRGTGLQSGGGTKLQSCPSRASQQPLP